MQLKHIIVFIYPIQLLAIVVVKQEKIHYVF